MFIKVCVVFVFGLQTLWLIDFSKIYWIKGQEPKDKGHINVVIWGKSISMYKKCQLFYQTDSRILLRNYLWNAFRRSGRTMRDHPWREEHMWCQRMCQSSIMSQKYISFSKASDNTEVMGLVTYYTILVSIYYICHNWS